MPFCFDCAHPVGPAPMYACPRCGAEHWQNPVPCAGALVEQDGQVLLVRRAQEPWSGHWDIPGGYCEPGELPSTTAVREVLEETGYKVAIMGAPMGVWLQTQETPRNRTHHCLYYRARVVTLAEPCAVPNDEISEVGFFGSEEIPNRLAFPDHIPAVIRTWCQGEAS